MPPIFRLTACGAVLLVASATAAQARQPAVPAAVCLPSTGLVYVGDSSAPPTEFLDAKGQPAGIHIDLLRGIERELGIPITIRLMNKLAATTAMQQGDAHLTALAQVESREKEFDFLGSTVRSRLSVLLRPGVRLPADPRDLSGLRITATRGSYTSEVLSAIDPARRPILVNVNGRDDAADLWKHDRVDGMAGSGAALIWLARSLGEDDFVEVPFETVLMYFVTQKGCGTELAAVTTAMQTLRDQGAVDAARERWVAPADRSWFWRRAALAGFAALVVLAGVLIWNRMLRQQVLERTSALAAACVAAESATKAKSEFLATMSHEIRTPLNAVIATASILQTTALDADQAELVGVVRQGGDSLLRVVTDILDFSKIEAGHLELHTEPFEIRAFLAASVAMMDRTASGNGLRLLSRIDDEVPDWFIGDSHRLRQVLLNLVSNALKFTASGSVDVHVAMEPPDANDARALRISVRDTGMGVPADRLHRLFEPFTQVDSSTTRKFGGTGLGLTISRSLIELMGGTIDVDTEPGIGSTFWFVVPLPVAIAPAALAGRVPVLSSGPLRVLMAEDNAVNQLVQRRMITRLGHTCDVVSNGLEAIGAAASTDYDVVVLDLQMPGVGGLEAAKGIRLQYHRPWIVFLTADATSDTKRACEQAGMDDYLTKPITADGLAAALARVPAARVAA